MPARLLPAALVFLAASSVSHLLSQPPAAPVDTTVYLSFFQQAAHQTVQSHVIEKVNGEAVDSVQPSIQDAMGITAREGASVVEVAIGCEGEIISLDKNASALIFESRLQAANEEKRTGDLASRLRDLDTKRVQIVLDSVMRLRVALGAARFKLVEAYVRSHAAGSFFPATPPRKL